MPRHRRPRPFRAVPALLAASVALATAGCVIFSRSVRVEPVPTAGQSDSASVRSPVKAHLRDGATIVFRSGATVVRDSVLGVGWRFPLVPTDSTLVRGDALANVVGMETFRTEFNDGRTVLYTLAATGVGVMATAAAMMAIFGSCPTVYADSAGVMALEAETFSGSIAPLLEARDVDRLRVRADADGRVRLEVRNEMLETHYLNHLALLEVRHAADETVLPDERGRPLAVGPAAAPSAARDRDGRDVRASLAAADERAFSSSTGRLARADTADMLDHVDATIAVPRGADSVAVVLRLRSSLLNTTVFYDRMLAAPGARSLDWLADDLARLDRVVELGRWYDGHFGVHVAVRDGDAWRTVGRVAEYGPIAWRDVALVIRAPAADSLRLRLSFVTDQWRIDRLAVAPRVRRPTVRTVPLAHATAPDGAVLADARAGLAEADERYLVTAPGQRFTATFDAGAAGGARTFLLASQGYYTEWVRGGWMAGRRDTATFTPSRGTLAVALRDWAVRRDSLEPLFFRARVPVR